MGFEELLSDIEIARKNILIEKGIKECKRLIKKSENANAYYFYEGSIDGFNECRKFNRISDYDKRIHELRMEETREVSKSGLKDDYLRESLHIYNPNEETNMDELYKLKGIRKQIEFIYNRINAFRILSSSHSRI